MEEPKYVTMEFEVDTALYKAAQEKLSTIGFSVNQYSVLCLLKCAQYCKEIPGCGEMKFDDLVAKIVSDVVEELILLHLNRDDVIEDPATHP